MGEMTELLTRYLYRFIYSISDQALRVVVKVHLFWLLYSVLII